MDCFFIYFNCSNESVLHHENIRIQYINEIITRDALETQLFFSQFFQNTLLSYYKCPCLLEKPNETLDLKWVEESQFNFEDSIFYALQLEFLSDYSLGNQVIDYKPIISKKENDDKLYAFNSEPYLFYDWISQRCPIGIISLSKPLFNNSYSEATVFIAYEFEGICSGFENPHVYLKKDNLWVIDY